VELLQIAWQLYPYKEGISDLVEYCAATLECFWAQFLSIVITCNKNTNVDFG